MVAPEVPHLPSHTEAATLIAELVERKDAQQSTLDEFEQAAETLELHPKVRALLRQPERVDRLSVPIHMADGRMEYFGGARVQHSTARGPARGGVRFDPGITVDQVKTLAMRMTWQWALLDIPLGGGKGGVAVDLNKLPPEEADRLTGDPLSIVPVLGQDCRTRSNYGTARGVYYTVAAACRHLQIPVHKARVAIQGFGNVGSATALMLAADNAPVVAASDTRGAVCNPAGLDVSKLLRHKQRTGSVVGFPGAEPITDCELLELSCELFIAAAAEHAIHGQNAPSIRARVIAEVAGHALTPNADCLLSGRGAFVIPALLANGGWAAAAYEDSRLEVRMKSAFRDVLNMSLERKMDLRQAANLLAVGRVANSIHRGY